MNKSNIWDKRFLDLAQHISTWSSCSRDNRQVGAIIVKNNFVLSTGYNGSPTRVLSCIETDNCIRDDQNIPSGESLEICYAIHAEQNAIVSAARLGIAIDSATLYCTHKPCSICAKLIINTGIKRVVYIEDYPDAFSEELFYKGGVLLEQITP